MGLDSVTTASNPKLGYIPKYGLGTHSRTLVRDVFMVAIRDDVWFCFFEHGKPAAGPRRETPPAGPAGRPHTKFPPGIHPCPVLFLSSLLCLCLPFYFLSVFHGALVLYFMATRLQAPHELSRGYSSYYYYYYYYYYYALSFLQCRLFCLSFIDRFTPSRFSSIQ